MRMGKHGTWTHLIPVEEVARTELEVFQVVLLHKWLSENTFSINLLKMSYQCFFPYRLKQKAEHSLKSKCLT